PRRFKAWASAELLILDDVGLGQVKKRDDEPTAAHTLYNLVDRRHGRASTAVSSNIDLSDWGKYLGDATLTAAVLDRLAMHAIHIDINGPSFRQHVGEASQLAERGATPATRRKSPAACKIRFQLFRTAAAIAHDVCYPPGRFPSLMRSSVGDAWATRAPRSVDRGGV